jgi:AcrR family transcriptional regulator
VPAQNSRVVATGERVKKRPAKGKSTTKRKGRPPQELPPRARELMAAALELFSERDFAAVTIKEIASAIGVNTALIYYYFDNKGELFRASLEYAVGEALANYERLRERHSDPVDLIADWLETNAELAKPIRQLIKIMLDYSTSRTQKGVIDAIIGRFYDVECGILSSAIRQGVKSGVFRPVDPDRAAHIASTHLDGIMVRSLIHKDLDIRAAMSGLKDLLWEHLNHRGAGAADQRVDGKPPPRRGGARVSSNRKAGPRSGHRSLDR